MERKSPGTELIDVLDRVLDKGIRMDASTRLHLATIDLHYANARMIVTSMETCSHSRQAVGLGTGTDQLSSARSAPDAIVEIDHYSAARARNKGKQRA